MIIDCIADLHGFYPELEGGDLLIVAGDLTARDLSHERIINALKMIKGVSAIKPYINGAEDWMMYEKGVWDTRRKIMEHMSKSVNKPED